MEFLKNLISKYAGLQTVFRSFFLVIVLFLLFFAVNLFISINNKKNSAYKVLSNETHKTMLQDTRMHNWDEIQKDN